MTQNKPIQGYEFGPMLTTSELLEAEIKEAELKALKEEKEHRKEMAKNEKVLSDVKRATAKALRRFLKNPTAENAEKAKELTDFYSDFYKDVNEIRTYWMREAAQ